MRRGSLCRCTLWLRFSKSKEGDRKIEGKRRREEEKKVRKRLVSRGRLVEKLAGLFLVALGLLMLSGYGDQFLILLPYP